MAKDLDKRLDDKLTQAMNSDYQKVNAVAYEGVENIT